MGVPLSEVPRNLAVSVGQTEVNVHKTSPSVCFQTCVSISKAAQHAAIFTASKRVRKIFPLIRDMLKLDHSGVVSL